jgi:hypothetical protein
LRKEQDQKERIIFVIHSILYAGSGKMCNGARSRPRVCVRCVLPPIQGVERVKPFVGCGAKPCEMWT